MRKLKTKTAGMLFTKENVRIMGFIKHAIIGIAIYEGVKYLTKKDALGNSKFDEIKEQAPEWLEKAKSVTSDIKAGHLPQV